MIIFDLNFISFLTDLGVTMTTTPLGSKRYIRFDFVCQYKVKTITVSKVISIDKIQQTKIPTASKLFEDIVIMIIDEFPELLE